MKKQTLVLFLSAIILFVSTSEIFSANPDKVNSVIGDISFISKFGYTPSSKTDNELRIKTHLEYVEQLLRKAGIASMSPDLKEKRIHLLDLLHIYIMNAIFPSNYDYIDERIPCFIDKDGNICAVGYLIEQTSGREIAELIDKRHRYELIKEMKDKNVCEWIENSGLTEEECAMIQPQYEYEFKGEENEKIVLSSVLTAANLTFDVINGVNVVKGSHDPTLPVIAIVTGLTQTVAGIIYMTNNKYSSSWGYNQTEKIFSALDIGVGVSAIVLSIWNLTSEKKPKKKTSWNIYTYPAKGKELGLGVSLRHLF
jgi:hypothetical protein